MEQTKTEMLIVSLKKKIKRAIQCRLYDEALALISHSASLQYNLNRYYADKELESQIRTVADALIDTGKLIVSENNKTMGTVLFYDGFGMNSRGLAQIYLKALGKIGKLHYVTYETKKEQIPNLIRIVTQSGGEVHFLRKASPSAQIYQLNDILHQVNPADFFFYAFPDDVIATTVMHAYAGKMNRYQINLTDHAYWLGTSVMDKCIEFRDYGASVSAKYRDIPKEKIVQLPFYPIINKEAPFQGYPFAVQPNQKVIFSGGSLYKTLGDGNKYYHLVDHILSTYPEVIFWYAGFGDDTQMQKIIQKYPGRAYLTRERSDLHQVLQHCYFYLSTYPLCGGLMYQYAACAGKIPLTLRQGDINDGFLINQNQLGVDFDSMDEIKAEIHRIMTDEQYAIEKSQKMYNAVIREDAFENTLRDIMAGGTGIPVQYYDIDTEDFRRIQQDSFTMRDVYMLFFRKDYLWIILKHYPVQFTLGLWEKIKIKVRKKRIRH